MDSGMLVGIGVGGCFVLIFVILGIFLVVKYFRDKKKSEESMSWASAAGQIIESTVRRETRTDSEGRRTHSYYPEVRYSYEYMGVGYEGDQIAFGGKVGGSRGKAEMMLQNYPLGKDVIVYCDPNNPENVVLERRVGSKAPLIVGIIFISLSLIAFCIGGVVAIVSLLGT